MKTDATRAPNITTTAPQIAHTGTPQITNEQFTELIDSLEVEIDLLDGMVGCETTSGEVCLYFYGMRDQGYKLIFENMYRAGTWLGSPTIHPTAEQLAIMQEFLTRMAKGAELMLELHKTEIEEGRRWPEEIWMSKYGRGDLEKLLKENEA